MGSTWTSIVAVLFTLSAAVVAGGRRFARAVMADANFFTYRFEVVLAERKRRLDIAEHLRHLGEFVAADEQVVRANQLVARACLLTRMSPGRTSRNRLGAVVYSTTVVSALLLGMSMVASLFGHRAQALPLSLVGAVFLLLVALPTGLVLAYLVDKEDKKARVAAENRAAQYTNPTTYPVSHEAGAEH